MSNQENQISKSSTLVKQYCNMFESQIQILETLVLQSLNSDLTPIQFCQIEEDLTNLQLKFQQIKKTCLQDINTNNINSNLTSNEKYSQQIRKNNKNKRKYSKTIQGKQYSKNKNDISRKKQCIKQDNQSISISNNSNSDIEDYLELIKQEEEQEANQGIK